jgi:hypothetical protein
VKAPFLKVLGQGLLDGAHCSPVLAWCRENLAFARAARAVPSVAPAEMLVALICMLRCAWGLLPCRTRRAVARRLWECAGRPGAERLHQLQRTWQLTLDTCNGFLLCPLLIWVIEPLTQGHLRVPGLHEVLALGVAAELLFHAAQHRGKASHEGNQSHH